MFKQFKLFKRFKGLERFEQFLAMKKILLAFQFLTIIPIKEMKDVSEKEMGEASAFFPVVGAFQGLLLVSADIIFMKIFPSELTNGLLVVVLVLSNGGFHLDGIADTFDAVASKGDREEKLAIMKDSTIGPIGVIAVILTILLKLLALNAVSLNLSLVTCYLSLSLMPVFSRWAVVPAIFHAKPARQDGIGKTFIENTGLKELVIATLLVISYWLLVIIFSSLVTHHSLLSFSSLFTLHSSLFLLSLPVLYIFSLTSVWFFNKRFGGMTGDTLGAVSEISEILFLLMVLICSQDFI